MPAHATSHDGWAECPFSDSPLRRPLALSPLLKSLRLTSFTSILDGYTASIRFLIDTSPHSSPSSRHNVARRLAYFLSLFIPPRLGQKTSSPRVQRTRPIISLAADLKPAKNHGMVPPIGLASFDPSKNLNGAHTPHCSFSGSDAAYLRRSIG